MHMCSECECEHDCKHERAPIGVALLLVCSGPGLCVPELHWAAVQLHRVPSGAQPSVLSQGALADSRVEKLVNAAGILYLVCVWLVCSPDACPSVGQQRNRASGGMAVRFCEAWHTMHVGPCTRLPYTLHRS
jgi:hypothetical protein